MCSYEVLTFYTVFLSTFLVHKFVCVHLETWFNLLAFYLTWEPQPAGTLLGEKNLSRNDKVGMILRSFFHFFS
jgi:hypothetical protein